MEEDVKPRRRYRPARRAEKAAATQRRIIDAARRLFLRDGYAATTIAALAAAADVSPESVYAIFGSKRGVLSRLIDAALVGDLAPAPLLVRGWVDDVRAEPDQRRRLSLLVRAAREILERASPVHAIIRSAAASDPEIAALRREHEERRLATQTEFVRLLAAAGPLREGLTVEDGGERYWILASPELHHTLTVERGWPQDRYEAWLADALAAQLLPCAPDQPR